MKTHTSAFKENIKKFGRELDSIISYELEGETIELGGESLNSVTPHYQGAILKSVMKQLDIDSNVDIPIGTELNYQFGIKINNSYEYLDFGNYIVYSSEKQEDTNSYKIVCYDKMLYSMKDYENIGVTYPITIRSYINAICTYLGLIFANSSDTFANYDKQIPNELYLSSDGTPLDYTFRDVLDELAQVTASTICINDDDELEIRYINDTEDTIDEEYLKDVNVNFGEKFGPVNVIVLSRSAGSDNIYYPTVLPQNPYELKISDNQIMNGNNRSEFLPDIYNELNGLEYYTNDFTSTGICYYNLCDRYNVAIGENTYSCVMFNDEINVTQGLKEKIYTDLPEETETDYTKADKTDRKINQTYLIVDKQNQLIQSLIDSSVYISNTINGTGSIALENAYKGRLYELSIKGQMSLLYPQTQNNVYGSSLVPKDTLVPSTTLKPSSSVPYQNEIKYPNSNLYPVSMILLIDNNEYVLNFGFLNYIDNDVCDEFLYHDGEYKVIRRVGIDDEGNKYALDNEFIDNIGYIDLKVDTNSVIKLKSFDNGIYKATYLLDNQYTDVFATKVELSSSITQTAEEINLEVSKKVNDDEIISKINQSAEQITINANKINLNGSVTANNNFKILTDGSMEATNGKFSGTISSGTIQGGSIDVNASYTELNPYIRVNDSASTGSEPVMTSIWSNGLSCIDYRLGYEPVIRTEGPSGGYAQLKGNHCDAFAFNNVSLADKKKNFEKMLDAIEIVRNGDIYKYNWKTEKDEHKKHIGFVIGENYNTPEEVINENRTGIDTYAMISVLWQAVKEQQEEIESLKEMINNGLRKS